MISEWSDRKIRSFGLESGRLLYVINEAQEGIKYHGIPQFTCNCQWRIRRSSAFMEAWSLQSIACSYYEGAQDGCDSCVQCRMILNSLKHNIRLKQLIKTTNIQVIDYLPANQQFSACGLDRFAKYFVAFIGNQLCKIELSDNALFDIAVITSMMKFVLVAAEQYAKFLYSQF
ncbi:MAG: hypothetical protein EZS28_005865 [Streblomastix strix]|uniref:Uncharacterized protein n=1 Tax=Streblomastix strix TaxID=222440 RepID=A0A5J4WWI3_9EUKA|nr:MAG: hypothetical protein EZS28_005865 [Streblomastix strix]